MEFVAYILVLVSAFTHAYWNFVLKRSGGTQTFIGLSKIAEVLMFGIPFFIVVIREEVPIQNYWLLYVVGAILVLVNYVFLGMAYRAHGGDLSVVYPVSRAGALLFLPVLAYFFIGEKIDCMGFTAISMIMIGLFILQLPAFNRHEVTLAVSNFKKPATFLALLAAFSAAGYTLWDKYSVSHLSPFIYFYSYTAIVGLSYMAFILVKFPFENIKTEWANHKVSILQVSFFNCLTYVLVLYSLQTAKASYVIAIRQLSIVFGVLLGWKMLQENFQLPKKIGISILTLGCLLVALAR